MSTDADAAPGLRFDVVAGLTAAAVVLPKAMAYATVAGLPVAVGLYTAFVPMAIYAVLGSSRVLSVSSTTTLAILAGTHRGGGQRECGCFLVAGVAGGDLAAGQADLRAEVGGQRGGPGVGDRRGLRDRRRLPRARWRSPRRRSR